MSGPPSISVVIRSFNSERTLGQVLNGMKLLEGDELIIVDSGSTDSTLAIAEKGGARVIIAPPPFHYSKSLNLGFRAAQNAWVLALSSHCVPAVPDLLEVYRREIALFAPDVVVGYAPTWKTPNTAPVGNEHSTSFYSQADFARMGYLCGNANTIYRRTAWEELPFDEAIRTAEDKLWIGEMVQRGYRFAFIPAARVVNRTTGTLVYMFQKGFRDARANRDADFKPMNLYHLGGALKNLAKSRIKGEIDTENWIRRSFHSLGQFFGSHMSEDNTPVNGGS